MKIKLAKHAGFCFGVRRATEMAEKTLAEKNGRVFCLGELIHNVHVVKDLESKGLKVVDDLKKVPCGSRLMIRSHGASPEIFKEAEKKGIKIIDATCPFVRKAQEAAKDFHSKGFQVVIAGDKNHPEVVGIKANTKNTAIVVGNEKDAFAMKNFPKIGFLMQTTGNFLLFKKIALVLMEKTKNLCVANTICFDSFSKKEEAEKMAKNSDILFVIGDKKSNNTKKLAEIGRLSGALTYKIESAREIKEKWFQGKEKISITAGASTPDFLIKEAMDKIREVSLNCKPNRKLKR